MPAELLSECVRASHRGVDFQTIWRDVLCIHPLVAGPALEVSDGGRSRIEIPLTTGQRLLYHRRYGFSLLGRRANIALRHPLHGR
jgi:hypothetical protein